MVITQHTGFRFTVQCEDAQEAKLISALLEIAAQIKSK